MRAQHNSLDRRYRSCTGALDTQESLRLAVDVWEDEPSRCVLRIWTDDNREELLEMYRAQPSSTTTSEMCGGVRYEIVLTFDECQVFWYSFQITSKTGDVWRYGAAQENTPGAGTFVYGEPAGWQVTVFHNERTQQPLWYTRSVVYQIFPDRFMRDDSWRTRAEKALAHPHGGTAKVLVDKWDTYPSYTRNPDRSLAQWDFYGGSLLGIVEKLSYLENLGISALYLNPITCAASNHRYDTADYFHVDPLLGTDEDFVRLCSEAQKHGISIILDGVFNHVGADSIYFNAYKNYGDISASDPTSPYHDWFNFDGRGGYESWWGVRDLPSIKDGCRGFRELICGKDGVVRTWLRRGARGWRLDVVDEISDEFVEDIKRAALAEKADAVVIGEVWEDASHKRAYGKMRKYFQGKELDATMNYPLRAAILSYVTHETSADLLTQTIESLSANYPHDVFYAELNLLGSHDRARLLTLLGKAPAQDSMSEEDRWAYRLGTHARAYAKKRLKIAALIQVCMPGVPCVYYGDEAGLEGYSDPFCRATFPWSAIDVDCYETYAAALHMRQDLPVLVDGELLVRSFGFDVFGLWRCNDDETLFLCVNTHESMDQTIDIPTSSLLVHTLQTKQDEGYKSSDGVRAQYAYEIIEGTPLELEHDHVRLNIPALGARVVVISADDEPYVYGARVQSVRS